MGLPFAGVALLALLCTAATLAATMPLAHAQSFSVATNKDVYDSGERVIVAGALPDAARGDVVVQITKDDRQCALQILRPSGLSFVSRPLSVGNCGPGEYIVAARYLGGSAESRFIVAGSTSDSGSEDFRLHAIKKYIMEAQERATEKVREVIDSGIPLPQQAAESYRAGVIETSLALQAAEYGEPADMQEHQTAAFVHFRKAIDALSSDRLTAISQAKPQYAVASEESDRLAILQDLYRRLVDLAEKNNLSQQHDLGGISELLSQARSMAEKGDTEGARGVLDTAGRLLEQARVKMVEKSEAASIQARLTASADRLKAKAGELLQQGDHDEKARQAISLIDDARSAIMRGDYGAARDMLSSASKLIQDAQNDHH
ncbi:MAG: hypothetical protein ABI347_11300 [Nitrososphaera sp.]